MSLFGKLIALGHVMAARLGMRKPLLTCREVADFIDAYRAAELPAKVRKEFELHAKVCPPCVAYLDSYEKTVLLEKCCRDDPAEADVPPELIKAILAARDKSA